MFWMDPPRTAAPLMAGLAATVALFLLMQELIRSDALPVLDSRELIRIDYLPVPPDDGPPPRKDRVDPPPPPDVQPPTTIDPVVDVGSGGSAVSFEPPAAEDPTTAVGTGFVDGNALSLVQVRPDYPRRAITRGIEGYVLVEFDIDARGAVVNPRVVRSEPGGVFDSAALRAIERSKYRPKVVAGEPVPVFGVQQLLSFEIED